MRRQIGKSALGWLSHNGDERKKEQRDENRDDIREALMNKEAQGGWEQQFACNH